VPCGLTIDNYGDIYVADWMNERVVIFDAEGKTPATWGGGDAHENSKWAKMGLDVNRDMSRRHRLSKNPEVKQYSGMPGYCGFDKETNRLMVCDNMR